jgi:hypothetical protein
MTATTGRTSRGKGYASPGAVSQHGGSLPIRICNSCGKEVVWVESARTGRPYLVTVLYGYNDQRYYRGDHVHPRDCGEQKAQRIAELAAADEWRRIAPAVADVSLLMVDALRRGEISDGTFLEALDTLAMLHPPATS